MKIGRLCVITDTKTQKRFSHVKLAELALNGGADMIQFRDKTMPTAKMIESAVAVKELCARKGAKFIINDRIDVAIAAKADGVHLGSQDIPVEDARKLLGRNKTIGRTSHSVKEAIQAERDGADYVGFGHIFPTETKMKKGKPRGIPKLAEICSKVKIPVLAIGGINCENASEVISAGAHGIAVIGAVARSGNPSASVRKLRQIVFGSK